MAFGAGVQIPARPRTRYVFMGKSLNLFVLQSPHLCVKI